MSEGAMKTFGRGLILLGLFVCAASSSCPASAANTVDFFVQWADSQWLGDLSQDWQRPFQKPFKLLGKDISNCGELTHALNGGPLSIELTTRGYNEVNPFVMGCADTSVMGRLHPAKLKLFDAGHLLEDLYLHLDAVSLPWSLGARTNHADGATYAQLKARKPAKDDDYLFLDLHERTYLLRPILMGALSADGPEVVYAVFEEDEHPKMNRQTGVVLLVRDQAKGLVKAIPVTLLPPEYSKAPPPIDHVYWGQ